MLADIAAKTLKQRMSPAGPAAAAGRNGDQILAHISPKEAELLKRLGGSGTINPETGVMEFWGEFSGDFGGGFGGFGGNVGGYDAGAAGNTGSFGDAIGGNQSGGFGVDGVSGSGGTSGASSGGGAGYGGGNSYSGSDGSMGVGGSASYGDAMGGTQAGGFGVGGVEGYGGTANGGSSFGGGDASTGTPGGFDVSGGAANNGFNGFGTAIGDSSIGALGGSFGTAAGDPALAGMGGGGFAPAQAGEVSAGTPTSAGAAATADIPANPAQGLGVGFGGWSPFGIAAGENVATGRTGGSAFGFGNLGMGNVGQPGALLSSTLEDGPVYGLPETLSPAAGLRGMAADPTGRHPGGPGDDSTMQDSVSLGGGPGGRSSNGSVTTDTSPQASFGFGAGMSKAQGRGYDAPSAGPAPFGNSSQFASTVPGQTTMARDFPAGTPIADAARRAYEAYPDMPKGYLEGMYGVETRYGSMRDRPGSAFSGPFQQSRENMATYGLPGSRNPQDPYDAAMAAAREYAAASAGVGRNLTPTEAYVSHQQGVAGMRGAYNDPTAPISDYLSSGNVRANHRDPNMSVQDFINSWQGPYFDPRSDYRNPVGTVPPYDSMMFR